VREPTAVAGVRRPRIPCPDGDKFAVVVGCEARTPEGLGRICRVMREAVLAVGVGDFAWEF